ncbi:hypothetical protein [Paenibacillus arenosi]|uniref:hypothetical protein n=1 Tax=Paenibacillus arenosi TaxID=2774142 RepID=UPI001CDCFAB9|nr:hypothetical protein [Paenibacillus arenosi]
MVNKQKQYEIIERRPTVLEHKRLWEAVGWGNANIEMTERSIANSVYAVVVVCDDLDCQHKIKQLF